MASFSSLKSAIFDREERKQHYQAHIQGLNAYDKHKLFLNDYVKYYGKERPADQKLPIKTDQDALREGYRGLRWRTEKEVMSGKGQLICGNKHCDERDGLASFEVNFSYVEAGENKQALVKLVACNRCAEKLHYRRSRERDREESQQREDYKRNRKGSISDEEVDDEDDVIDKSRTKSEYRDKKSSKRRRKRSSSAETTEEETERSKEGKKKGKRALAPKADLEEEENFDEFLEGMFP